MRNMKTLLAAAAFTALTATGLGAAGAAPFHHREPVAREIIVRHDGIMRHDMRRPIVVRERVFDTLRFHRFRGLGEPYFFHGRYVVRSFDRFGRVVLVQVDPYTGALLGVI